VFLDGARVDEDRERLQAGLHEELALFVVGEGVRQADVCVEKDALVFGDVVLFEYALHDYRWILVQLVRKKIVRKNLF